MYAPPFHAFVAITRLVRYYAHVVFAAPGKRDVSYNNFVTFRKPDYMSLLYKFMLLLIASCALSTSSDAQVKEHEDLRAAMLQRTGKDLNGMDLRESNLSMTIFDSFTPWPPKSNMPEDFDPDEIMNWAKDPGLGVRDLHEQGVDASGVHVAIIDQPLFREHSEYNANLVSYTDVTTDNVAPQMHGTVASILVGETCGVAPSAILHYWAEPSWEGDYRYRCEALQQIIDFNKDKDVSDRIRVVSVSKGFSPDEPNLMKWEALLNRADESGIFVAHCSMNMSGAGCKMLTDRNREDNYEIWTHLRGRDIDESGTLFVPVDNRTTSSYLADDAYIFWSKGGLSWGAPYVAGVVALGIQVDPSLTNQEISQLLYETGSDFFGGKLINPSGFIESIKKKLTSE
jgi:subtilisin family serine protease